MELVRATSLCGAVANRLLKHLSMTHVPTLTSMFELTVMGKPYRRGYYTTFNGNVKGVPSTYENFYCNLKKKYYSSFGV